MTDNQLRPLRSVHRLNSQIRYEIVPTSSKPVISPGRNSKQSEQSKRFRAVSRNCSEDIEFFSISGVIRAHRFTNNLQNIRLLKTLESTLTDRVVKTIFNFFRTLTQFRRLHEMHLKKIYLGKNRERTTVFRSCEYPFFFRFF